MGHFSHLLNFVDLATTSLLYFASMQINTNSAVLSSLLVALKPIARLLMKAGIGYREFSEIAKCAFVDVSTSDYGLRGRPTNISRVAVMTGLTRKEVKRIREKISAGDEVSALKVNPPTEILHRWHSDPVFTDESGRPLVLPFDGAEKSFSALVKRYGGDIPPGAMRTELTRVNAVREVESGMLEVTLRHYRPVEKDNLLTLGLGTSLFGLAHTINHNLSESDQDSWVQRVALTKRIRREDTVRVRRIAQDRAAEFVESVDDLFSAYETIYPAEEAIPDATVVGVGVYYFEADSTSI